MTTARARAPLTPRAAGSLSWAKSAQRATRASSRARGGSEFGALGAQSVEDDATAGRPAAASDALNFDVLLRMLGGATGACCSLLTDDDDAPEASAALLNCKELPLGVGAHGVDVVAVGA